MYIIINKVLGENNWNYPDVKLSKLTDAFDHPTTPNQLIVKNETGKTLAELTALSSYPIVEYTGLLSSDTVEKLVGIGAIGELLPDAVRVEIRGYALDSGVSAGKRQAASRIVTRFHSNEMIDANGEELESLLTQIFDNTALTDVEQDAILAALRA